MGQNKRKIVTLAEKTDYNCTVFFEEVEIFLTFLSRNKKFYD